MDQENSEEPIEFQISDELDLHTFRPGELGELIPDYIGLCLQKNIFRIRIIHGKESGLYADGAWALKKRFSGLTL